MKKLLLLLVFIGNLYSSETELEKNCNDGFTDDCYNLAVIEEHTKRNDNEAKKLHIKACNNGIAISCYNLAMMYEKGIGREKSPSKATKFYTKACNGNVTEACFKPGVTVNTSSLREEERPKGDKIHNN